MQKTANWLCRCVRYYPARARCQQASGEYASKGSRLETKILRIMKLTAIMLTVAFVQVFASGRAQSVTLSGKDLSLKEVFAEVKRQTGYVVFGKNELFKDTRAVSVNAQQMALNDFLALVMKEQPLNYTIDAKTIILSKKTAPELPYVITPPISGVILSADGKPLAGASIKVKGTSAGTTTDQEGRFNLKVDAGQVLIISYTGYETREYKVSDEQDIRISLIASENKLNEVTVNAGYYRVKQREATGSISKIDAATISQQPVSNPLEALSGRVPGLYIEQSSGLPGANFQVRIRGTNSLRNGNDPLYIVDGTPFPSQSLSDANTSTVYGFNVGVSPMSGINPQDIESIEVLKDADATAIYGSRGANGVILITTKKGGNIKPRVNANVYAGAGRIFQRMDLMNTKEYLAMRREALARDGRAPRSYEYDINGVWDTTRDTDWQKELLGGTAHNINANLSVSGGNAQTQFLMSGGYENVEDVYPGKDYMKRFSILASIDHTSSNGRFNARMSTNYVTNNTRIGVSNLTNAALTLPPTAPKLYGEDGDINWENSTWPNPLAGSKGKFLARTQNLVVNAEMSYKIVDGLRLTTLIGINDMASNEFNTSPSSRFMPSLNITPENSTLTTGVTTVRTWNLEPKLYWNKIFGKLKLSSMVATQFQQTTTEATRNIYRAFLSDQSIENPKAAKSVELDAYNHGIYRYNAVYAYLNLNWEGKYIINATGRRDGSSRFGPGRQFADFGAVGFAWIFTNEHFMRHLPFISFGKLRGSFGATGNDQIGNYRFLNTYTTGSTYQGSLSLVPTRLFNPDYGWELNRKAGLALELGFAKDRILLTAEGFRNQSSNQLVDFVLSSTTGFMNVNMNFPAVVRNSGLEVSINTVNIHQKNLSWESSLNFTLPKNRLISFPGIEKTAYAAQYEVGKSLQASRRFKYLGLDIQTGLFMYEDVNKDGNITYDSDMKYFYDLGQQFFGGLNNRLVMKGLELNIFFQFVKQRKNIYSNGLGTPGSGNSGVGNNQPAYLINTQWQKPGDQATAQYYTDNYGDPAYGLYELYRSSNGVIRDASFVRLKTVSASYTLPERLSKSFSTRVYVQCQNLFVFSNYEAIDPETSPYSLPPMAHLTAGVQLTF